MTKNRRACWNCDGSVHIHNTKCPYCGTDLTEESASAVPPPPYADPEPTSGVQRVQSESPYVPPVAPERVTEPEPLLRQVTPQRSLEPETPFIQPEPVVHQVAPESSKIESRPQSLPTMRGVVLPMLMLLPGAFFLLFSAILILFSSDGVLTLQWNAHYWLLYIGLALPLLYFGWRAMNRAEALSSQTQKIKVRD